MYLTSKAYPKRAVRTAANSAFLSALCLAFLFLSSAPVHAQRFVKVANTIDELVRLNPTDVHTNVFVSDPDRGGVFTLAPRGTTNRGTALASTNSLRQWNRQFSGASVDANWFGASTSASAAANTTALQDAIDFVGAGGGGTVRIPIEGTLNVNALTLTNRVVLRGLGRSVTKLKYPGSSVFIQKAAAVTITSVGIHDLTIEGTDGNGGTGLLVDSFRDCSFSGLTITLFRNAGDTGVGLHLKNTDGLCVDNTFIDLALEDCDILHKEESVNASNSTGYNTYHGLRYDMAGAGTVHGFQSLSTVANGGIYSSIFGLKIQSRVSATGIPFYIEGNGNIINGIIIDQPGTNNVMVEFALTTTTANWLHFLGGFDSTSAFTNRNAIGVNNTIIYPGSLSHPPNGKFEIWNQFGQQDVGIRSLGNNGAELHFGNDGAGSQAWRFAISASATPSMSLFKFGVGPIQRWQDTEVSTYISASEKIRLSPTGVVFDIGGIGADAAVGFEVRDPSQFTGNALFIGNVTIDHGSSLYGEDTAGTAEAMIGISGANNTQILSPTIGGGIQLITRHAAGPINFLPGGLTNVWQMRASDGAFVNSAGAPRDIGEVGNFIGRLHAANVRVSSLTANQMVLSDANKDLASGSFGPTLTNIGGVLDAKYIPGTNVVFVTNSTSVSINVGTNGAAVTDTDGYIELPTVTTTDSTATPIFTNTPAINTVTIIHADIYAIENGAGNAMVRSVNILFLDDGGSLSAVMSDPTANQANLGTEAPTYDVTASIVGGTTGKVFVDNNGAVADVKWKMRYRIQTHSF